MPRDLIIGILLSILFHGGFLFGEQLMPKKQVAAKKVVEEEATIELLQMPPPEPEEIEVQESDEPVSEEVAELAPPMAADVPSMVTVDSFVQKLQPPPPPGMQRPTSAIVIPTGRPTTGNLGQGMKDLFDLANLDQQPVARFQAKPVYPFEMRRAGITGEVLVAFIVDSNGDVREAFAVRSSQREFEASAVQAVSKWKFRPGKKGGRNVNTKMQVPIVFSITED
jgi:protein TonB